PRVALGVDERGGVAAPEGRRRLPRDPRSGRTSLLDDRVDLVLRPGVVRERDAAPPTAVGDAAVLRELVAPPERDDHPAGLEEDDVVVRLGPRRPAERLVEPPSATEVGDAEGDQAEPLVHGG